MYCGRALPTWWSAAHGGVERIARRRQRDAEAAFDYLIDIGPEAAAAAQRILRRISDAQQHAREANATVHRLQDNTVLYREDADLN